MPAQKKAKTPEPPGESAPMWIVSFADLVTLLMSFFVVLYAMKQGGEKKQLETMAAIKVQFDPNYVPPDESPLEWQQQIHRFQGKPGPPLPNNGGNANQPSEGATGRHQDVQTIRAGKVVAGGRVTFKANSVVVDGEQLAIIKEVVAHLRGRTNILLVKGNASADEVALRPDDPNGMSLSYQRAIAVCAELRKLGIDDKVLRPVPCGIFEPVKTEAYQEEQQRENRGVEVYATDNTAADFTPVKTVPVAGAAPAAVPTSAGGTGHGPAPAAPAPAGHGGVAGASEPAHGH